MIVLPIPAFVAAVLVVLALRTAWAGQSRFLTAFLVTIASQALLIALVQHYGIASLRIAQPVLASVAPPLAWLTFACAALRPLTSRDWMHAIGPALTGLFLLALPAVLDLWIPGLYVGYGATILWRLRGDADLPLSRLEAGGMPLMIWRALGASLLISALSDVVIVAALILGRPELHGLIVSIVSSLLLLIVGLLPLSRAAEPAPEAPQPAPEAKPIDEDAEASHMEALDRLLAESELYLDPNLSLARLARRIGVPEKTLSAAINRRTGANVSRYINGKRIAHACALLKQGTSVTDAMLESGFNTKSNFNREFTRVTGQTPSQWRATNSAP